MLKHFFNLKIFDSKNTPIKFKYIKIICYGFVLFSDKKIAEKTTNENAMQRQIENLQSRFVKELQKITFKYNYVFVYVFFLSINISVLAINLWLVPYVSYLFTKCLEFIHTEGVHTRYLRML